jgi:hypothetical protein
MRTLTTLVTAVTFLAGAPALAHGRLADISVYDRTEGRWLEVARGIIREPIHVAPTPPPFPGFVPDPRG